jgi:hypothetical protein
VVHTDWCRGEKWRTQLAVGEHFAASEALLAEVRLYSKSLESTIRLAAILFSSYNCGDAGRIIFLAPSSLKVNSGVERCECSITWYVQNKLSRNGIHLSFPFCYLQMPREHENLPIDKQKSTSEAPKANTHCYFHMPNKIVFQRPDGERLDLVRDLQRSQSLNLWPMNWHFKNSQKPRRSRGSGLIMKWEILRVLISFILSVSFRSINPTWECSVIAHSGIDTTLALSVLVSSVYLHWALKVRFKYGLLRIGCFNEQHL